MPISTDDFPKLTDDLESIFDETASSSIALMKGKELFDFTDEQRLTHEELVLHGVAGIKKVAEGADLPRITSEEGDSIIATQSWFGAIVPVTKHMRKFDLHNQIEKRVRSVTEDAFDKIDQSLADVLSYGAATSYTDVYGAAQTAVGPDGLALFSAAHTNGVSATTFSNIINDGTNNNPALSRNAIQKAQSTGLIYTDPNGLVRPVRLDLLIVPPSLGDLADRIVNSVQIQGSANNDTNTRLKNKIKSIIEWERLEVTGQGASRAAYWYLADSSNVKNTLQAIFAERPSLDAPEEVYSNKDWEYSIDFYYSILRSFAPYVRQSDGTGS